MNALELGAAPQIVDYKTISIFIWAEMTEVKACPYFKDPDCKKKHPFRRIERIYPAINQLECTAGEQVCTRVPAHVGNRVEIVCNLGDCGPYYCSVLSDSVMCSR